MENNSENENGGFWLGLLIGGAIGAAAGYLFSSEDKKKALLELKEKGRVLLENVGEWKDEAVGKGEVIKKVVEKKTAEVAKQAGKEAGIVKEEIKDTAEAAKEAIQRVEQVAKEAVEDISQSVETSVKTFNPKKKGFGKFFFKKGQALIKK